MPCTASISLCGPSVRGPARTPETVTSQLPGYQSDVQEILLFNPYAWCPDPRAAVTSVVINSNCSQCRSGALWGEVFPSSSSWRSPGGWDIPPWWAFSSNSLFHLGLRTPALVSVSTSTLPLSVLLWTPVLWRFSHSDPNIHRIMDLSTSEWATSKTEDQCFLSSSGKNRSEWRTHTKEKAVIKSDMQSIFERFGFFMSAYLV